MCPTFRIGVPCPACTSCPFNLHKPVTRKRVPFFPCQSERATMGDLREASFDRVQQVLRLMQISTWGTTRFHGSGKPLNLLHMRSLMRGQAFSLAKKGHVVLANEYVPS